MIILDYRFLFLHSWIVDLAIMPWNGVQMANQRGERSLALYLKLLQQQPNSCTRLEPGHLYCHDRRSRLPRPQENLEKDRFRGVIRSTSDCG